MYTIKKIKTNNVVLLGRFKPCSYKVIVGISHDDLYILYYNTIHTLLKKDGYYYFNVPNYIDIEYSDYLMIFVVSKDLSIWQPGLSELEHRYRLQRAIKRIYRRLYGDTKPSTKQDSTDSTD